MEILTLDVLKGVEVSRRGMAGLGPGDVEADDAGIAPPNGELGDLATVGRGAHGAQDRADRERGARRPGLETFDDRPDHLVERQPSLAVQFRSETHLGVDDAVRGQVLSALPRHSLERVGVLHNADGVGEGLEVEHQVVAFRAPVEPAGQVVDIGGRQR